MPDLHPFVLSLSKDEAEPRPSPFVLSLSEPEVEP